MARWPQQQGIRCIIAQSQSCCGRSRFKVCRGSALWAGGEIKLRGDAAHEQRLRLKQEGVQFQGKRVDMAAHEHTLRSWETFD